MNAVILYWSLTGTTRRVAERIAEGLRAEGTQCTLHDVRDGIPADAAAHDIIGVGFPVHWYRPPTPVSDAIAALGPLEGRSVFTFSLNGTYRGAGLNRARAALARAGGVELGVFSAHGEGSFYPYARLGAQFSPGHPDARELESAFEFGRAIAQSQARRTRGEPPPAPAPVDPPTHPMYALERLVSGARMTRAVYSRLFRADPTLCTKCGTCARRCPTHNIAWSQGEMPHWGRDCVLCLECRRICPEEAVSCPLDWAVFRPFVRWNVDRAWRDPDLDHARVQFKRGKFVRL